jgi:dTDP-4-dehydrorhamnose reductase
MTIFITGKNKPLSLELRKLLSNTLCPDSNEVDLTSKNDIENYLSNNDVDTIIHVDALHSIKDCEDDKALAMQINFNNTKNLVDAMKKHPEIKFILISTPCVFNGKDGMFLENSIPYPVNFYGSTKLLAEKEVETLDNFLIIRTNYVARKPWPYPEAFTDRFSTYLFADQVAKAIVEIISEKLGGILHITGDKKISMFELAKITTPDVKPITMENYSGPALNVDMSLDTKRWKKYTLR